MMTSTVILALTNEITSAGVRATLQQDSRFKVAGVASNSSELRTLCIENPYALVLLDSRFTGGASIEGWRRLSKRCPDLQLLLWGRTVQDVLDFQSNIQEVDGYLLEDASPSELLSACRSLSRGQMFVAASVAAYFAKNPRSEEQRDILATLSDRELQVMQMISQGIKVADIAVHLSISNKTVNTFRYRIFVKLKIDGDVALTHLAISAGLVALKPIGDYEQNV